MTYLCSDQTPMTLRLCMRISVALARLVPVDLREGLAHEIVAEACVRWKRQTALHPSDVRDQASILWFCLLSVASLVWLHLDDICDACKSHIRNDVLAALKLIPRATLTGAIALPLLPFVSVYWAVKEACLASLRHPAVALGLIGLLLAASRLPSEVTDWIASSNDSSARVRTAGTSAAFVFWGCLWVGLKLGNDINIRSDIRRWKPLRTTLVLLALLSLPALLLPSVWQSAFCAFGGATLLGVLFEAADARRKEA